MSNYNNNIGFIGAGHMGMALLQGLMKSKTADSFTVYAYDVDVSKKQVLSEIGVNFLETEIEVAQKCKYIFFLTRPGQLEDVLFKIEPVLAIKETVLVSLCAGISEEFILKRISDEAKIVLVMPNTPMMLGLGASAMARGKFVSAQEFEVVTNVIGSCGITEEIPIDKMNEIICINASSPAFIYLFAKGFIDYASGQGINAEKAMSLFSQALIGSAKMLTDSGKSVDELIEQVALKGGTTEAGLKELYKGNLCGVVGESCKACTERAKQLAVN